MQSREIIDYIKLYVTNGHPVMLSGVHGVGKTAMVAQAFQELGYNSLYFSASTMDPFIELLGIPRRSADAAGREHLTMLRRKEFEYDEVDAIFVDEYNRSPPTVRNALLEIIQYKAIHGHTLNRLKAVVVAINPDDNPVFEYDVEKLDPTQKDKITVHLDIPYEIAEDYMVERYGTRGQRAAAWWNNLPEVAKYKVSPRRLCSVLDVLRIGGRIEHVLPPGVDRESLTSVLEIEDDSTIKVYAESNDVEAGKRLVNDPAKHRVVISLIENDPELCKFYLPLIKSDDMLGQAAKNNPRIYEFMLAHLTARFRKVITSLLGGTRDTKLIKPALKADLFEFPRTRDITNEERESLEMISLQSLNKSTEILYAYVMACKAHGTLKQNRKAIARAVENLTVFDDHKVSASYYPFVYAELKPEKVKGLFEPNTALFQLKVKQYKARPQETPCAA